MRYVPLVTLIVGSLLVLWLLLCGPAPGASPAAHAAALASVESTAPASAATVRAALKAERSARDAYRGWSRARDCLGLPPGKLHVERRPDRQASAAVWLHARDRWRRQSADFRARQSRLVDRMTATTGGGALRWKPLVLWVWRCSDSLAYLMCHISWHESSGSPFRWNTAGSGAFGIWQLLPKPPGVWGPMSQAKAALRKYKDAQRWWGNGLAPWAGCRAFTCSGGCGMY